MRLKKINTYESYYEIKTKQKMDGLTDWQTE